MYVFCFPFYVDGVKVDCSECERMGVRRVPGALGTIPTSQLYLKPFDIGYEYARGMCFVLDWLECQGMGRKPGAGGTEAIPHPQLCRDPLEVGGMCARWHIARIAGG